MTLNPWVEGSSPSGGSFHKALQVATLRHNGFTRRDLRQPRNHRKSSSLVPVGTSFDGTISGTGTDDVTGFGTSTETSLAQTTKSRRAHCSQNPIVMLSDL